MHNFMEELSATTNLPDNLPDGLSSLGDALNYFVSFLPQDVASYGSFFGIDDEFWIDGVVTDRMPDLPHGLLKPPAANMVQTREATCAVVGYPKTLRID